MLRELVATPLYWLLVAVPVAVACHLLHVPGLWVFMASCVAIIPLAGLMGRATESLADSLGPAVGGLLNATFGNAAELIIALLALWAAAHDPDGPDAKYALVKASITGSIIGNILLVLGLAITCGGIRHQVQHFNRTAASMGSTMLTLAAVGLIFPTLHYYLLPLVRGQPLGARLNPTEVEGIEFLSEEIAVILAVVYLLSLFFSLRTHRHLFGEEGASEAHEPEWGRGMALTVLLIATAGVALLAEFLVHSVEDAAHALGMNQVFIGVIVVAIVGNAAEHSTAVLVAMKNKMDLAVNVAVGSSIQIALFVAPVLVFASMLIHPARPLDLHFTPMEIISVLLAVGILGKVSADGESHWMEGVMLLAVYAIMGLAFYYLPGGHGIK